MERSPSRAREDVCQEQGNALDAEQSPQSGANGIGDSLGPPNHALFYGRVRSSWHFPGCRNGFSTYRLPQEGSYGHKNQDNTIRRNASELHRSTAVFQCHQPETDGFRRWLLCCGASFRCLSCCAVPLWRDQAKLGPFMLCWLPSVCPGPFMICSPSMLLLDHSRGFISKTHLYIKLNSKKMSYFYGPDYSLREVLVTTASQ
mmetsp:Transcript_29643/g.69146  ORF Transcript_29643/g.69146 Transcript_29643/m.69146 type:complete len:202 (+) Transcript_29643:1146-1751(+)